MSSEETTETTEDREERSFNRTSQKFRNEAGEAQVVSAGKILYVPSGTKGKSKGKCLTISIYDPSLSEPEQRKQAREKFEELQQQHDELLEAIRDLEQHVAEISSKTLGSAEEEKEKANILVQLSSLRMSFAQLEKVLECVINIMLDFYKASEKACSRKKSQVDCEENEECTWVRSTFQELGITGT